MSIPGSASPLLFASVAAEAAGYQIDRSLRFNSADSAYLNRTPSVGGNRRVWTYSVWVKRHILGTEQQILRANVGTNAQNTTDITFYNDQLWVYTTSGGSDLLVKKTTQVFRDPSAWLHIVVSCNSPAVTIYVNGDEVTDFSVNTVPASAVDYFINHTTSHLIGRNISNGSVYADFSLANAQLIDGQALAASDFGEYDEFNNWNPKAYSGTYGTNGFHLDFSDTSDLGADAAGSNDWTPNNLVGTAGLSTANQGFDVVTYTGNGSTQSISSLAFQPDFVWIKRRNSTNNHRIFDTIRGVNKSLSSDLTSTANTSDNQLTAFNPGGFALGSNNEVNQNTGTYVAWCWKAGGTPSSNTDGTITSQVSASTDYGFSICTYTGDGSGTANSDSGDSFGHGLSSAPKFILCKRRNSANGWPVYHASTALGALSLNGTNALDTGSYLFAQQHPSSSVVYLGNNPEINATGSTYVAYCWSEVPGFSKFGSFTHASTTSLNLGFKPKFFLIKETDGTTPWYLFDAERDSFDDPLFPNTSDAEANGFAFTANDSGISWVSGSLNAGTYIYAAFAAKPDESVIDSLIDTPTNYDDGTNVGGNYATLNPLQKSSGSTLSNGNLDISMSSAQGTTFATMAFPASGKYYFECTSDATECDIGIAKADADLSQYLGKNSSGYGYYKDGNVYNNDSSAGSGASYGSGDIIGVAFDADAGTCKWYKNNVLQVTISSLSGEWFPAFGAGSAAGIFNFGQRPFAYTPPTGYKSLCTTNLPDPTIADGSTAMDAVIYSSTGSAQTISGLNISPDLVWIKNRSATVAHRLYDIIRGVNKPLTPNDSSEEANETGLSAFNSDGFSVSGSRQEVVGTSGNSLVGWAWDAGSSTVSNTDGSITSTVRANANAGFSIVKYSGNSGGGSWGHSLNTPPEFIIFKRYTAGQNWFVWLRESDGTYLEFEGLNNDRAAYSSRNNVSATNSVVTLTTAAEFNSDTNSNYIAYCFSPVSQFSAFGEYTGNGSSSDGPFVYTGFRPKWLLLRCSSILQLWLVLDSARDEYNIMSKAIQAHVSDAEIDNATNYGVDFTSNGFKIRSSTDRTNGSGQTYIYAAFAEHPFKTARAR
jgi:hypothetical protein